MNEISFDSRMVRRLRTAYAQAQKENAEAFVFEGNTFVTAYAKYLLEYLEPNFGIKPK